MKLEDQTSKKNRVDDEFKVNFDLRNKSRSELRKETVNKFLAEKGGYWEAGKKHVTHYIYYVEKLVDGRRIYLLRPTFLNKGIDFQVWVEKLDGKDNRRPSHKDVFSDLNLKKKANPRDFIKLMDMIRRVWNCEEPDTVLKNEKITFNTGFSVELLLKILKWLFIEQDITYWNYDGRGMLMLTIEEIVGK